MENKKAAAKVGTLTRHGTKEGSLMSSESPCMRAISQKSRPNSSHVNIREKRKLKAKNLWRRYSISIGFQCMTYNVSRYPHLKSIRVFQKSVKYLSRRCGMFFPRMLYRPNFRSSLDLLPVLQPELLCGALPAGLAPSFFLIKLSRRSSVNRFLWGTRSVSHLQSGINKYGIPLPDDQKKPALIVTARLVGPLQVDIWDLIGATDYCIVNGLGWKGDLVYSV